MGKLQTVTLSIDEKIRIVDKIIANIRASARAGNAIAMDNYEALKSVAADLQARKEIAKNDTLTEMEMALSRVLQSKTGLGFDEGQLIALASVVIRRWSTIAQALEQFQKEHVE